MANAIRTNNRAEANGKEVEECQLLLHATGRRRAARHMYSFLQGAYTPAPKPAIDTVF